MGALCCEMTFKVNYDSNNATSLFVTSRVPVASKDDVHSGLRAAEQVVDGRYGDGVADGTCERGVHADEGIGLKLGQGDVFGHEGVGPAELVGDLPGEALQHAVAQEAQPKATQVVELALGGLPVEFTAPHEAVELGQDLGADQGRRQELVLRRHNGLQLGQVQGDIGADHESCHCVALGGEFVARAPAALVLRVGALDTTATRVVLKSVPRSFWMARAVFGVMGTWRRTAAISCPMSI